MKREPAKFAQTGGINQSQQSFPATQRFSKLIPWQLLQSVQPLSKPESKQGFSLTTVPLGDPASH